MLRLGLCCTFRDEPIKFANTTVAASARLSRADSLAKLSALCLANADALLQALGYCAANGIGCFRVCSQILPLKTHPTQGYAVEELPDADEIVRRFRKCGRFAQRNGIRTSFHPDQFVVLNSQRPEVVDASLREIEYQAEVAQWIGADVINIHGGGAFGNKRQALDEFARNFQRLSTRAKRRLTIENDDKVFTPADLLPLCQAIEVPLVYDVHHHRCLGDRLSIEEATEQAIATWNREPMFHLSSPLAGWDGPATYRHHDFIDIADLPASWRDLDLTIEIEAKAKEAAVLKFRDDLATLAAPRRRNERMGR